NTDYQMSKFIFSSGRRHTRSKRDWSSDVCSSDLKVKKLVERFFGNVVENLPDRKRDTVILTKRKHLEVEKPIHQVHYMLGVQGYGMHHPKKMELLLLNNILGGAGMSSVLNLAVREKYGIAYTIESHYGVYYDTGIFSIYMGTDKKKY